MKKTNVTDRDIMISMDIRGKAIETRILENRYLCADECTDKVVDRRLRKRAGELKAEADFLSKIADFFAGR